MIEILVFVAGTMLLLGEINEKEDLKSQLAQTKAAQETQTAIQVD